MHPHDDSEVDHFQKLQETIDQTPKFFAKGWLKLGYCTYEKFVDPIWYLRPPPNKTIPKIWQSKRWS